MWSGKQLWWGKEKTEGQWGETCHYLQVLLWIQAMSAMISAKQKGISQVSIQPDKLSYSLYKLYNGTNPKTDKNFQII